MFNSPAETRKQKLNLPKSLWAIISSWSSFKPRLVAKRNCQLNISPNCGQGAAGQLAKNTTSCKIKEKRILPRFCKNLAVQNAPCCISHLGVLADQVEPEDRRPGTLLLAGVGDDDHWKGGGLGGAPVKSNLLFRSYFNHHNLLHRTHSYQSRPTNRRVTKETPPAAQQSSLYAETQCQSRWCAAPLWHWEKSVRAKTHTSTSLFGCPLIWWTNELNTSRSTHITGAFPATAALLFLQSLQINSTQNESGKMHHDERKGAETMALTDIKLLLTIEMFFPLLKLGWLTRCLKSATIPPLWHSVIFKALDVVPRTLKRRYLLTPGKNKISSKGKSFFTFQHIFHEIYLITGRSTSWADRGGREGRRKSHLIWKL